MPNEEIENIRKIRHQISQKHGHDLNQLFIYYKKLEEEFKRSGKYRFEECNLNEVNYKSEMKTPVT